MKRADIDRFFKTLILGDFEEDQSTSAQIIGGLISLIPILDQVMDIRDISGALFRINKQGGFDKATTDQVVNLGFAAFGAIPEVGSAFKTVFKPLWKERQAAKGLVHGGTEAIEALLGMKKGGAITWIRQELLGKWASRSQQAVTFVDGALASCIDLMDFVANASGWKDWLIPDPIQAMAKELLPSLKGMRSGVGVTVQRASDELKAFLEDILGEQAAVVVMAMGDRAVASSAVPGTRPRSGHNAADPKPKGSEPPRQAEKKVSSATETQATKGAGPVHAVVQVTRKTFRDMAAREKGLIGEHVVDYHEAQRLSGNWLHDKPSGQWSPDSVKKINVDKRPINLALADLPKVTQPGIDAVWEHNGQFTVTEAKASESIAVAYGFGKYKVKQGWIPDIGKTTNPSLELLHFLLSDSSDKQGKEWPTMQMSHTWSVDRANREDISRTARDAIEQKYYERRVALVTLEANGALDHAEALADIHMLKPENDVHDHTEHGVTREWLVKDIDAVENARIKAHETGKTTAQPKPVETNPQTGRSRKK